MTTENEKRARKWLAYTLDADAECLYGSALAAMLDEAEARGRDPALRLYEHEREENVRLRRDVPANIEDAYVRVLVACCQSLDLGGVSASRLAELIGATVGALHRGGLQRVANALFDAATLEDAVKEAEERGRRGAAIDQVSERVSDVADRVAALREEQSKADETIRPILQRHEVGAEVARLEEKYAIGAAVAGSITMTPEARASCEVVAAPVKNWPAWKKAGAVDVPQTGIVDRVAFAPGDRVQTPGGPGTVIYGIASAVNSARNGSYAVRLDNANPASPARSIYPVASLSRLEATPARDYEADLLAVADALGLVNWPGDRAGYEIAPVETIVESIRKLQRDESKLYDDAFCAGEQAAEEQIARWHDAQAGMPYDDANSCRCTSPDCGVRQAARERIINRRSAHRESADAIRAGKHREGK